jgi:hypothetical protein
MKQFTIIIAVIAVMFGASAQATIHPPEASAMKNAALIEKNLTVLLESQSLDLRAGAIQVILELKRCCPQMDLDYTIIPLLACLRDEDSPELRIMAGTALYELDTHLGRYAVERRALYDSNEWVTRQLNRICRAWEEQKSNPASHV